MGKMAFFNMKYFKYMVTLNVMLNLCVCYAYKCENKTNNGTIPGLADLRVIILGQTGVGKSSLANVLLGRNHDPENETLVELCLGHDGCFVVDNSGERVTHATCYDTRHWLGNESYPKVTIIDTPGFGEEDDAEHNTINGIVDVLKTDVKYINVFVLAFSGYDTRQTRALANMLMVFENMFGGDFWNHVIIEVTKWHHYQDRANERGHENETHRANLFNNIFSEEPYNVKQKIPVVFIDSIYPITEEEREVVAFEKHTDTLYQFIVSHNATKFSTLGIKAVKTELQKIKDRIEEVKNETADLKSQIEDLKLQNAKADDTNQQATSPKPIPSNPNEGSYKSGSFGSSAFAGFGIGMCFLGLLVGFGTAKLINKTSSSGKSTSNHGDSVHDNSEDNSKSESENEGDEMKKLNDVECQ